MTDTAIRRMLVANRGEIAARVIRTCRDLGIRTVAVLLGRRRGRPVRRRGRRGRAPARRSSAETYLDRRRCARGRPRARAPTPSTPATDSCPRTPGFAHAVADAGLTWVGPTPSSIEAMGDKMAAKRLAAAGGVPLAPGCELAHAMTDPQLVYAARRSATRSSSRPCRRWRQGHAGGGLGRGLAEAVARGPARGGQRVRRRHRLPRALRRGCPPRRDPGPRRRPRQRRAPRRARVLDPAAPPEDHRGVAVARVSRRRCACGWARPRWRLARRSATSAGTVEFLVSTTRGAGVLLPRDEHPAAGRAPGDRGDHGHRPRARADLASRDGERLRFRQDASSSTPVTPSRPGSTPRTRRRLPARRRDARSVRPGPPLAVRSTRESRPARRSASTSTRCWPRSSPTQRRGRLRPASLAEGLARMVLHGAGHEPGLPRRDAPLARLPRRRHDHRLPRRAPRGARPAGGSG